MEVNAVDGQVGNTFGFPVFQADGVDHHQPLYHVGIHEREAACQHAAHGVAHNGERGHVESVKNVFRVCGQLLQTELICFRFVGLAEADLIGKNDPVPLPEHDARSRFPCDAAKILAMKHHNGFFMFGVSRVNVHVGLTQRLMLCLKLLIFYGPWIGVFEAATGSLSRRSSCRTASAERRSRESSEKGQSFKDMHCVLWVVSPSEVHNLRLPIFQQVRAHTKCIRYPAFIEI